jgi:hypothetical protein
MRTRVKVEDILPTPVDGNPLPHAERTSLIDSEGLSRRGLEVAA